MPRQPVEAADSGVGEAAGEQDWGSCDARIGCSSSGKSTRRRRETAVTDVTTAFDCNNLGFPFGKLLGDHIADVDGAFAKDLRAQAPAMQ